MAEPTPYDECSEDEQMERDLAAECAREEMEEMGIEDEEFIDCVCEEILDGHSVAVGTLSHG